MRTFDSLNPPSLFAGEDLVLLKLATQAKDGINAGIGSVPSTNSNNRATNLDDGFAGVQVLSELGRA